MVKQATTPAQNAAQLRAYFAKLAPGARRSTKQVRAAILSAAPGATEVISYSIPAYKVNGRLVIWLAGWKHHVGIYPIGAAIVKANASALKPYVKSKATIRFPLDEPMPSALIKRLVKARVAEVASRGK